VTGFLLKEPEMAMMQIEGVRAALAKDGTVTVPAAEDMVVGKVLRDGAKWAAAVADEAGKVGRTKTEHATRQAAFVALRCRTLADAVLRGEPGRSPSN
jgi:nicotinamide mononucleotide (NMN) deamidase PncC